MRSPLLFLPTLLLCLAMAACHRSAVVERADPNPVGQWQWSNPALGAWNLDILADGTFLRETKDRVSHSTISTSGRWKLTVNRSKPNWFERHQVFQKTSAEEEFLHSTGIEPAKRNNIQLSAPAAFSLFYYLPKDGERSPEAVWTGPTLAEAILGPAPAGAVGMEERRTLRTFSDISTGDIFLDLEGKTFRKVTASSIAKDGTTHGNEATEPAVESADFRNIEAFLGIALDLPKDWVATDPEAPAKPAVPLSSLAGHPRAPRPNSTWRFAPVGESDAIFVLLGVQPPTFTAKQVEDATQVELDRFATGFVKGASHALESKGYFLKPDVTAERIQVGGHPAVVCTGQTIDPTKNTRSIRVYTIPTGAGTILLACCWDPEADPPLKPIIERVYSHLRIAESFKLSSGQ